MPVVHELTGVWDSQVTSQGSKRRQVPLLRIPRGADVLVELAVVDEAGAAVDLSDPTTAITLTCRRQAIGADLVFPPRLAVVTDGPAGLATIFIASADTQNLQPGLFAYDVWMQQQGDDQPLVPVGQLQLETTLFQTPGTYAPPIEPPSLLGEGSVQVEATGARVSDGREVPFRTYRVRPTSSLRVLQGGRVRGQHHQFSHQVVRVPAHTRMVVPPHQVLRFSGVLQVKGLLEVHGAVEAIPPAVGQMTGQEILDALSDIAPNAPYILGGQSPVDFQAAAAGRAILGVLSAAQVQAAVDAGDAATLAAALAAAPPLITLTGVVYGANFNAEANKVNLWNGTGANVQATLPVAPVDGERVAFFENDNGDAASLVITAGPFISWPGGTANSIVCLGRKSYVELLWSALQGRWYVVGGHGYMLAGNQTPNGVLVRDGSGAADIAGPTPGSTPVYLQMLPNSVLVRPYGQATQSLQLQPDELLGRESTGLIGSLGATKLRRILDTWQAAIPADIPGGLTDDYSFVGWNEARVVVLNGATLSDQPSMSGFVAPTGTEANPLKFVQFRHYDGSANAGGWLALLHEHGGSLAANRIWTPNGRTMRLRHGQNFWLWYDLDNSRWRVLGADESGELGSENVAFVGAPIIVDGRFPNHTVILTQVGHSLNVVGPVPGQRGLIRLGQNTGGFTVTTWEFNGSAVNVRFPGGVAPVLSAGAGQFDTVEWFESGGLLHVRLHETDWS